MEIIHITSEDEKSKWQAHVGKVAIELLERKKLDISTKESVLNQTIKILENCGDPQNSVNNLTGLVVGYVQSGKTLSFTTLAALAAENGFNVIIVIAGTTTSLVDQTYNRLEVDLQTNLNSDISWKTYKNPSLSNKNELSVDLEEGILNKNPVLLITLMKNSTHLKNLIEVVNVCLNSSLLKVLIIDDEADQASLNTKASKKNDEEISAIYGYIRKLKNVFPNHSYLQYTATPQAPLFISLLDILSPSFVHVLKPGPGYTGGKTFFLRNKKSLYPYIVEIPEEEIYTKGNIFNDIPQTLIEATMFFFLTVAIGALNGEKAGTHNRTMMVHPSQLQNIHIIYHRWIIKLKERWIEELSLEHNDSDRLSLENTFQLIYSTIISEEKILPDFNEVLKHLKYLIKVTQVSLSNSSIKNEIDFKRNYSMILVGGQVLDRGFTVEGLNVTYMPRSVGVGNADTLQQRCRFFGYKYEYLDYCRIYLPRRSKRAYIDYVTHEEDMRNKLERVNTTYDTLKDFKRVFILSKDLNLTRKNVISDDIRRYRLFGWRAVQHLDPNYIEISQKISNYINSLKFEDIPSTSNNATDIQTHQIAEVNLMHLIENLLLELQYKDASNSLLLSHFVSLLGVISENDNEAKIHIVNMSKGSKRVRSIDLDNKIINLFQGANKKTDYLGDRFICSKENITVQFHNVEVKDDNKLFRTVAIHFPDNYGQDLIVLDNNIDGYTD
jgi:hypothetical protein